MTAKNEWDRKSAQRIQKLIIKKGYTVLDVIQLLDIGYTTANNWWNGRNIPSPENAVKLAELLGCTVRDVVGEERSDTVMVRRKKYHMRWPNGNRLRGVRNEKGLTIKDVSDMIGMSTGSISLHETMEIENVPNARLEQYAGIYGVTVKELLGNAKKDDSKDTVDTKADDFEQRFEGLMKTKNLETPYVLLGRLSNSELVNLINLLEKYAEINKKEEIHDKKRD